MSDESLCKYIAKIALEFPSVDSLQEGSAEHALDILSRDVVSSEGVRLTRKDEEISVELHVVVEYGTQIPKMAWELQQRIQSEVKNYADIDINEINIHIEGVKERL